MLTIRKEQYSVFEQNEILKFENPTYIHLNQLYPEQCQDLGEPRLRRMIKYGIQRAATYEIRTAESVHKYIEVMLLLGQDFDKDSNYPWAEKLLNDENLRNPKTKADRVHESALQYLSKKA
jgi:hypothetical protein